MTPRSRRLGVWLLISVLTLAGCETTDSLGTKTAVGGLGGAAAGGLLAAALGARGSGIAAGVLLGGALGGAVGSALDAADRRYAEQATHRALETTPSGMTIPWNNPDSGHSGRVTPQRTYRMANGQYCREFQQEFVVDGQRQRGRGTACRQADGNWQITN